MLHLKKLDPTGGPILFEPVPAALLAKSFYSGKRGRVSPPVAPRVAHLAISREAGRIHAESLGKSCVQRS